MYRRAFLAGLALLAAPIRAAAQPVGKQLPRVGVIWDGSTTPSRATGLRQGLRDLGYTEGQNILIEDRHAAGRSDQVRRLAEELIALGVDVLVVGGTPAAQAEKAVTQTVPNVLTVTGNPWGS